MSMDTSLMICSRPGWRTTTWATGAGGAKRRSSYAGITHLPGDLLQEVHRLFRPRQPWTRKVEPRRLLDARDHDIDLGTFRQPHRLGELDLTVLDRGLICSDLHRMILVDAPMVHRPRACGTPAPAWAL